MVEVDLRLFVTCRLCLDVQGHFQIDPSVQRQIKYCFDIDVEPFDGLPQLICKKCENILREHYAIKKNFTDKQKELKTKLQDDTRKVKKSPSPQPDLPPSYINKRKASNVSSSRLGDSDSSNVENDYLEKTIRKKKKVRKKRIVNRLISSSCDDDDLEPCDSSVKEIDPNANKHSCNENPPWDVNLNRFFVCRICSEGFRDKGGITQHIKEHSSLRNQYKHVFKNSCLVVMKKCDNESNICSSNNAVVYSSDSIIQNKHNPLYYIKYHPKSYSNIPSAFKSVSQNDTNGSESTDTEIVTRKRRVLSRSSSETVVINRHSEHEDTSHITEDHNNPPRVIDCIDLGDSSDNGSYKSNERSGKSMNRRKLDSKPMHNIIKMCHNRYTKQLDSSDKKTSQNDKGKEEFLQHKVLSIGRKIINNKGFNCTGILRFLEYKDLSIVWKETSILNSSNDKYVRIATRIKGNESNDTNSGGWKNFNLFKFDSEELSNSVSILKRLKTFANFKTKIKETAVTNEQENINCVEQLPCISSVFSHTDLEITKTDSDNLLLQKLLNKNPVLNPKQLRKKVINIENYSKTMKVFSAPSTVYLVSAKQPDNHNDIDSNSMPIVTSTVSLAPSHDIEKSAPVGDSTNSETPKTQQTYLKVKPVSELMPEKTATNINSNNTYVNGAVNEPQISSGPWPNQNVAFGKQQPIPVQANSIVDVCNSQIWQNHNNSYIDPQIWPNQNKPLNQQQNISSVNNVTQCSKTLDPVKEFVLLDTVEFPNTKTASPFQYFQNLLLVHNITLMDANQPLPVGSVPLIKLKLVYQQNNCKPITLCLSLHCCRNLFCIQIKDTNLQDVNIHNLSANWQWQLLQIYNNDVITKVLQTAGKISTETFEYTKYFFNVLKSIKSKNEEVAIY